MWLRMCVCMRMIVCVPMIVCVYMCPRTRVCACTCYVCLGVVFLALDRGSLGGWVVVTYVCVYAYDRVRVDDRVRVCARARACVPVRVYVCLRVSVWGVFLALDLGSWDRNVTPLYPIQSRPGFSSMPDKKIAADPRGRLKIPRWCTEAVTEQSRPERSDKFTASASQPQKRLIIRPTDETSRRNLLFPCFCGPVTAPRGTHVVPHACCD